MRHGGEPPVVDAHANAEPLRVLVLHNAYQQAGGEDAVVEAEVALLRAHGHAVATLLRHNDELGTLSAPAVALQAMWSRDSARRTAQAMAAHRPDVVHVHNTWPLLSPSVFSTCQAAGVPVVQTLHNFRLACPQAMFLRDGRVCTDCLGRTPWPAIEHACYRQSRAQTAVLAGHLVLHRQLGTWQHRVDRFIALNAFCRDQLLRAGLPAQRVLIKPHFVAAPAAPPADAPRQGLLFVGRLSPEKGLDVLKQALHQLQTSGPGVGTVQLAGDGPMRAALAGAPTALQLLGELIPADVGQRMRQAAALVLPSICLESFPRVLVEAFAAGLPVIASRLGALAELVQHGHTGLLFEPGDARSLADQLAWAAAHPLAMARMGQQARAVYEAQYTPERNIVLLRDIYAQAGARSQTVKAAAATPPASR
jgi:glycosyltransferase involved in cell wall biosynthesis